MPLTDTTIRSAKPGQKPIRLLDGGGLYLDILPNGGKWWRFKYRIGGKENGYRPAFTQTPRSGRAFMATESSAASSATSSRG